MYVYILKILPVDNQCRMVVFIAVNQSLKGHQDYLYRLFFLNWGKTDKSWLFIGRTDAEAETPVLWPPHAKN